MNVNQKDKNTSINIPVHSTFSFMWLFEVFKLNENKNVLCYIFLTYANLCEGVTRYDINCIVSIPQKHWHYNIKII